ncbi:MAG: adenylosuccinate lyase [Ardenticatenaceae bacterium]|nr:adenylosuccinate lyase [Ardenticatenaceae bacterium]
MSEQSFHHNTYISVFTWRYGSPQMRHVWSEENKRRLMRQVWIALARAQEEAGLVTAAQVADLEAHADQIDIPRAQEIERETRHDVMAEIRAFAEQCPVGGRIIHWGATSADVNDNVYALRIHASLDRLLDGMRDLLLTLSEKIRQTAAWPVMAHTHIQPAEPTTLGYRFAVYAQDLWHDWQTLSHLKQTMKGKGFKGAVGTQASYKQILKDTGVSALEMDQRAMEFLGIKGFPIATQTYSRQQDLRLMNGLAGLASSLHKFALDFRILQSPPFGEWAEPFGKGQVGSSAMPFKRNPINTENICSLARYVASLPAVAWDNASQAILERSLDDSANRRIFIAEGFLATEEILRRTLRIIKGMVLHDEGMKRNMATYGPFAASEKVLMALVQQGGSRQDGHEWLREASLKAWTAVQRGQPNPLIELLASDERLLNYLESSEIREMMQADGHTGTAAERALNFALMIENEI